MKQATSPAQMPERLADVRGIRAAFARGNSAYCWNIDGWPRRTGSLSMMSSCTRSPEWKSSMAAPAVVTASCRGAVLAAAADRPAECTRHPRIILPRSENSMSRSAASGPIGFTRASSSLFSSRKRRRAARRFEPGSDRNIAGSMQPRMYYTGRPIRQRAPSN